MSAAGCIKIRHQRWHYRGFTIAKRGSLRVIIDHDENETPALSIEDAKGKINRWHKRKLVT